MQKIETKFDFTMEDFAEAQKANLAEASSQRGRWIALYVLAAIIFGVGVYAYVETQRIVIAFGFWLLALIVLMLRKFKLAGATADFRKQVDDFRGLKLTVADEGIWFRTDARKLKLEWQDVKRFRETETVFVLYPASGFLAIPKRALTPEQVSELHGALVDKISSSPA